MATVAHFCFCSATTLELHRPKTRLLEDAVEGGSRGETAKLTLDDLKRLFNPCRSLNRPAAAPAIAPAIAAGIASEMPLGCDNQP